MRDLAELVERGWSGLTGAMRPRTSAALFRQADRYRNEGRYPEAATLVAEGLRQSPDSSVGHLLSAYLFMAARDMDSARGAFDRVLALDRYHPRALLGLARLGIEEEDLDGAKVLLDRALQYYSDFPEARALRDMLEEWASTPPPLEPDAASAAPSELPADLELAGTVSDLAVVKLDGAPVLARVDAERGALLAQHLTRVYRMASATLSRAGFGALRRGGVETESGTMFFARDAGTVLTATIDGHTEIGAGLAHVGRIWSKLGAKE